MNGKLRLFSLMFPLSSTQEAVIPFNVSRYGEFLTEALQDLEGDYADLLSQTPTQLGECVWLRLLRFFSQNFFFYLP